MALGTDYHQQECSLARALELVGERWTMLIVRDSFFGVRRFTDFHQHLGLSKAVLTQRLTALVEYGLLERRPAGGREEYLPTAALEGLWPAMYALMRWGESMRPADGGPRREYRHHRCATLLTETGACPSCDLVPGVRDVEMRPGPGTSGPPRSNVVSAALRSPRRLLDPIR